ncbi:alanine racemase [Bdellovibrionota bacterium FG-2]
MPNSRVWLDVNLSSIAKNFKVIQAAVKPCELMVVLKANAYGLGMLPIAEHLVSLGATRFGVAELKEALALKKKFPKIPVQILSGLLEQEVDECVRHKIICPVSSPLMARWISRAAVRQKRKAKVHFKVDTGMGRLGFPQLQAATQIAKALKLPELEAEGILSHFSNANNPQHGKSREQLNNFRTVLDELKAKGYTFPLVHMANSDAIHNLPEALQSPFNLARTGVNLYGVFDLEGSHAYRLIPSLALQTRLVSRRLLPAGHTIGYGCTHTLFRDTWVGTIPAGYADGIPLAASNSGAVLIRGQSCPVIGRVSMDYITVDLSSCPKAREGDLVTIVGPSGKQKISIEDWARIKQTHSYEIICAFGPRVERVYLD